MFNKGDIVVCIANGTISVGTGDFSDSLTEGCEYLVLGYYRGLAGPTKDKILVKDDNGRFREPFASRFVLAEEYSGDIKAISPVIRKIRQMEAQRKSLGYRW